ncbi:MAG: hypothetical protein WC239_09025 [Sphaerochaetaceae bacterium]
MKRILVISLMFVLVVAGLAAVSHGTGTLTVFGKIGAGDIEFSVNQTLLSTNRIDLVENTAVQPTGDGVEIGNWQFGAANQPSAVTYTVTYTYSPITQGGSSPASIPYELLIKDGATSTPRISGETTTINATAGTYNTSRDVLVRLTAAGVSAASTAPESTNYSSVVTVDLTSP